MSHTSRHIHMVRPLILLVGLAFLAAPSAAQDITGPWEMTMEFGGRPSFATLSIAKGPDGALTGKWGAGELTNVKFDGQKLTFTRTVRWGDNEFSMSYAGTLKDGKIVGSFSTDNGDFAANGARAKPLPPAVGQWDMQYRIGERDITGRLTVAQKPDGALAGHWTSQRGESTIANVQCQGQRLTFERTSRFNEREFKSTFAGTVQGDKLTGVFQSERGEMPAGGQRFGAALIGEWELTTTSDRGTFQGRLKVFPDLTGRYDFFGAEIPLKSLTLEGDQLTFALELGFGDQVSLMEFKGRVDGKSLKGQTTSSRGTADVTGKKVEAIGKKVQ